MASDGVHANIGAIQKLESAWVRFAGTIREHLPSIEQELGQATEALEERAGELNTEIANLEEETNSSEDEDDGSWAENRLEEKREQLATIRRRAKKLAEVGAAFKARASQIERLSTEHTIKGQAFLSGTVEDLKAYFALTQNNGSGISKNSNGAPSAQACRMVRFGKSATNDYRATFLKAHPELAGQVVVHHAVERQAVLRYPGVVTDSEINSLENLRGIPNDLNNELHLSQIRRAWNQFYRMNRIATQEQLIKKANEIDDNYEEQFLPSSKIK